MKSSIIKIGLVGGGLSVAFFFLCMFWGVLLVDPALKTLHVQLLKIFYPGFSMTYMGISIAFIEACIYGFGFGVLFVKLCKICCVQDGR